MTLPFGPGLHMGGEHMSSRSRVLLGNSRAALVAALSVMSAYSWWQTSCRTGSSAASTNPAPNTNELAEVEVTATRSVEEESKVPISLAVYSNEQLNIRGFRDATDMMLMTPGITYSNSGFLG